MVDKNNKRIRTRTEPVRWGGVAQAVFWGTQVLLEMLMSGLLWRLAGEGHACEQWGGIV